MSKVAGAFGWWRVAARVALGAAVLLAPALTRARDLAPTGDLAEGFDQDPSAVGAWQLSRFWTWDGAAGALRSSTAGAAPALWTAN